MVRCGLVDENERESILKSRNVSFKEFDEKHEKVEEKNKEPENTAL